jgi:hypothetical protein
MKISYTTDHGMRYKNIPKVFAAIRDVGKYFMSDAKRLTKEERQVLKRKLAEQMFGPEWEVFYKEISPVIKKDYIGQEKLTGFYRVKQPFGPSYTCCRFGKNKEVKCPDILYRIAKDLPQYVTKEIKRSY